MKASKSLAAVALVFALASCTSHKEARRFPEGEMVFGNPVPVSRVTGASLPGETLPNPNRTDSLWNLAGTDLGTFCDLGDGKYAMFFGDSFGRGMQIGENGGPAHGSSSHDWRSNVAAFTSDADLSDGLSFDYMYADPWKPDRAMYVVYRPDEYHFTSIPTAAICLNGVIYMHYMYWEVSFREHDMQGFSSFAVSRDGGNTWEDMRGSVRFPWDSNFGMVAMATKPGDKYCYMMGGQTQGHFRKCPPKLARFRYDDILKIDRYEYWNSGKGKWIRGDEREGTVILPGTGFGEATLLWMEKYNRWITLYIDSVNKGVFYSTAFDITGPWSTPRKLDTEGYGTFIHPSCATSGEDVIYFVNSLWKKYNVFLYKADVTFE